MHSQTRLWLVSQGRSAAEVDAMRRSDFEAIAQLFAQGVIGWYRDAAHTWMILDRIEVLTRTVMGMTGSKRLPPRQGFAKTFPIHAVLMGGATKEDLSAQVLRWRSARMETDPAYAVQMQDGGGYPATGKE